MSLEKRARQHWARGRIINASQPLHKDTLSSIGEIDGTIIKHPDGHVVVTEVALHRFILDHMLRRRCRPVERDGELIELRPSADKDNANHPSHNHSQTK